MDPQSFAWSLATPWSLLTALISSLVWAFVSGKVVPKSQVQKQGDLLADHVQLMADRLADKDAVIAAAHRETDLQREINRQLIAQIHEVCVEGFETVDAYIHALPAAGRRDATAIRPRHSPE